MSSPLNAVQLEANRRNAQQSTGPRTEIGKKTSSLNALRHGPTSRIVVLPDHRRGRMDHLILDKVCIWLR
jgi:hypothetical protein